MDIMLRQMYAKTFIWPINFFGKRGRTVVGNKSIHSMERLINKQTLNNDTSEFVKMAKITMTTTKLCSKYHSPTMKIKLHGTLNYINPTFFILHELHDKHIKLIIVCLNQ